MRLFNLAARMFGRLLLWTRPVDWELVCNLLRLWQYYVAGALTRLNLCVCLTAQRDCVSDSCCGRGWLIGG